MGSRAGTVRIVRSIAGRPKARPGLGPCQAGTIAVVRGRRLGRGFTLVELLVVLAIAGLMLALTPPLIGAALPGVELKGAARRTAAALRLTREIAIAEGRPAAWVLDLSHRRYRLDGSSRGGRLPAGVELQLTAAEAELLDDERGAIRFFPDGSSTGGRVVLSRDGRGYQVGVNWLTGRVLIADWQAD